MNRNQQGMALITAYIAGYKKRYGFAPTLNRYRIKWGMLDVVDSIGYSRALELIEYYFECDTDHSPEHFMGTFDRLEQIMVESKADEERRRVLREQTKKRMQEFEQ